MDPPQSKNAVLSKELAKSSKGLSRQNRVASIWGSSRMGMEWSVLVWDLLAFGVLFAIFCMIVYWSKSVGLLEGSGTDGWSTDGHP